MKPESRRQRKIRQELKAEVGGWWFKVWGGPFQQAGIPDILGCCCGLFFAFEVKTDEGETSKIQDVTIEDIRELGGGVAEVVRTPEEAVRFVKKALRAAGRLPKGGR